MPTYRVTWVIDVEQPDAFQAALEALEIMHDPESTALVFEVSDGSTSETIDLGNYLAEEEEIIE